MPASTSAANESFGRAAFIRPAGVRDDYPEPNLGGAKIEFKADACPKFHFRVVKRSGSAPDCRTRLLALLADLRPERQTKSQGHSLDRVGRAPELFRRLFQRSRRLGQPHEPAVFLERPGLPRHNRNDPLASTERQCRQADHVARRPCLGGPCRWGKPGAEMDM